MPSVFCNIGGLGEFGEKDALSQATPSKSRQKIVLEVQATALNISG